MNRTEYLTKIIGKFQKWYVSDMHSNNINYYKNTISKEYLESLSKKDFKDFFFHFVSDGGMVQSGGDRGKNEFLKTLNDNFEKFRTFILEPFEIKFNLTDWFKRIGNFKEFGVGIATIYLNRINKDIYPIMNNKTIEALKKLGYNISTTKNFSNYELVKKYQTALIKEFPILENFYKADALNHFIIAIYEGQWLINSYIQVNSFEECLEQDEIEHLLSSDHTDVDKHELLEQIKKYEKDNTEFVTIKGKRVKRRSLLITFSIYAVKFHVIFCELSSREKIHRKCSAALCRPLSHNVPAACRRRGYR